MLLQTYLPLNSHNKDTMKDLWFTLANGTALDWSGPLRRRGTVSLGTILFENVPSMFTLPKEPFQIASRSVLTSSVNRL